MMKFNIVFLPVPSKQKDEWNSIDAICLDRYTNQCDHMRTAAVCLEQVLHLLAPTVLVGADAMICYVCLAFSIEHTSTRVSTRA